MALEKMKTKELVASSSSTISLQAEKITPLDLNR